MTSTDLLLAIDAMRRAHGLLTVAELVGLRATGTVVLDPFSVMISAQVTVGCRTIIEPNVQLLCRSGGTFVVGDGNTFHAGTRIEAVDGKIRIGSGNTFGPGGFTALAATAEIEIGNGGRYTLNCALSGRCSLGSGSQILGPIAVDSCTLGAGGTHAEPDPDKRGAVLKGSGRARGIALGRGQVIQSFDMFDMADVKLQSHFHPPQGLA
jgi:hypothetical protein